MTTPAIPAIPAIPAVPAVTGLVSGGGPIDWFTTTEIGDAQKLIAKSLADNTWATYRSAWRRFERWCEVRHQTALPASPSTLVMYLTLSAGLQKTPGVPKYKASTLAIWLVAIRQRHQAAKINPNPADDDIVARAMSGIRRDRTETPRRVAPLLRDDVVTIVDALPFGTWPHGLAAVRDAAIILLGFSGAFRRSELAERSIGDLTVQPKGIRVRLLHSKTNQEGGQAEFKAIPFGKNPHSCPVCALHHWLSLTNLVDRGGTRSDQMAFIGRLNREEHVCREPLDLTDDDPRPLFRQIPGRVGVVPAYDPGAPEGLRLSGNAIYRMLKRRLADAGFKPSAFGGHSLRAGFVTEALNANADGRDIRRQTGHKTTLMLDIYDREQNPFAHNAVNVLDL